MRVFPVILVAEGDFLTHEMQHNAVGRLFASHFGHPVDIVHTDSGAPYIPEFDGFISVSHCATAVAVAISDRPVGIDVESPRYHKMRRVANKFISLSESLVTDIDSPTALAATWCAKEAIYKLHGGELFRTHVEIPFPLFKHILTIKHAIKYTLAIAEIKDF